MRSTELTARHIGIVIPIFNEQDNIQNIVNEIRLVMARQQYRYSITFIDDGSSDESLSVIRAIADCSEDIFYVSLTRNFGHQNALKAGIDRCHADCLISLDGDLQHPVQLITQMIRLWEEGNDIVYSIRCDDKKTGYFKRVSSAIFYKVINRLSDIRIENGCADFRLVDKKVVDILRQLGEQDFFWRGICKWVGFRQTSITYTANKRASGRSKYNLRKMVALASGGITGFSTRPLHIAIYLGLICSMTSLLYIPYILASLYFGHPISGWASILASVVFFGGVQLIVLGILSIYVGKLFMQAKQRPSYIIMETNTCATGSC